MCKFITKRHCRCGRKAEINNRTVHCQKFTEKYRQGWRKYLQLGYCSTRFDNNLTATCRKCQKKTGVTCWELLQPCAGRARPEKEKAFIPSSAPCAQTEGKRPLSFSPYENNPPLFSHAIPKQQQPRPSESRSNRDRSRSRNPSNSKINNIQTLHPRLYLQEFRYSVLEDEEDDGKPILAPFSPPSARVQKQQSRSPPPPTPQAPSAPRERESPRPLNMRRKPVPPPSGPPPDKPLPPLPVSHGITNKQKPQRAAAMLSPPRPSDRSSRRAHQNTPTSSSRTRASSRRPSPPPPYRTSPSSPSTSSSSRKRSDSSSSSPNTEAAAKRREAILAYDKRVREENKARAARVSKAKEKEQRPKKRSSSGFSWLKKLLSPSSDLSFECIGVPEGHPACPVAARPRKNR
ncbi:hypothetical protein B0T22DRAFT_476730 [Podospora appendiculata]|uniref:Uncharacterized protein n=1 Tax=Podospora appendiculata TaxID=314037 RepID=A0AAE0XIJ0_9PEZI|nr:hypothetical protein B0T22DRAFT_476730 [Podospora appendiculata]